MSYRPKPGSEFERLLLLLVEEKLTGEDLDRLGEILLEDRAAREYYVRYVAVHAALQAMQVRPPILLPDQDLRKSDAENLTARGGIAEIADVINGAAGPLPASPPVASSAPGFLGDLGMQGWRFFSGHNILLSVLFALVATAALVAVTMHKEARHNLAENGQPQAAAPENAAPESAAPESLVSRIPAVPSGDGRGEGARTDHQSPAADLSPTPARLVRAKDCRWNGAYAPQVGQMLPAGQSLNLASGVAEIDFDIGAKVIVQSPAALQLLSAKSARLDMGKATVEINAETARGFTILTPEATFVDQGTQFGVEVTPRGNSKIHVFQGRVDIDQKALAGQAALPTQRLVENVGARLESGEAGMTLVQDTGECFIRSMDDAGRDQHVVAYWRFEDRPVGILLPNTEFNRRPVCATVDSSFNGNDLYTVNSRGQPMFSPDVCVAVVPQNGCPNLACLDTTQPNADVTNPRNVYTHSKFSHAAPLDIQRIAPAEWTIEISVKATQLLDKPQGFLGRDANHTQMGRRGPARLTFQINARNRFAIEFYDADNRFHEAVAEDLPVATGQWYHLAATSDGRTLRLYVDALDGRGYVERVANTLPETGSTALGKGQDIAEWTLGRAGNAGNPADWLRFVGWLDEVRISDVARKPADFLFAPKDMGKK